jgi:translocation protein SEC62
MPQQMMQPSPQQIQEMQARLAQDAAKAGMSVPQYVEMLKQRAIQAHQAQQQQAQQQGGGPPQGQQQVQHQQPITPGPPNPAAIAVANFLKSQPLKLRTVLLDEKRRDMFRGTPDVPFEAIFHMANV